MQLLIPLQAIHDNPFQTRRVYDDVPDLAQRIAAACSQHEDTLGLLQVPIGRLVADDGDVWPVDGVDGDEILDALERGYAVVQLAFGHRRFRAFRYLHENGHYGYSAGVMPIRLADLSDEEMLDACWSENRERRDLSAVEEAELLASKMKDGGSRLTQKDVAKAWGLGRSTVANRLRLLEASERVQQANREGRLSERQALALLTVERLEEALREGGRDKEIEWGAKVHPEQMAYYDKPAPPGQFLVAATEDGADVLTADVIRKYIKMAVDHAGAYLPPAVAEFDAGDRDGVEQATCSGCPLRMNETCLQPPCLAEKQEAHVEQAAREWAAEHGLPYSEDGACFDAVYDAGLAMPLVQLWKEDPLALEFEPRRLVAGWCVGEHMARPIGGSTYASWRSVHGPDEAWTNEEPDPRRAIALGWRGDVEDLRAILQLANGQGEDEPVDELARYKEQWEVKAVASQERAIEAAREALRAFVSENVKHSAAPFLMRLWSGPAAEPGEEAFLGEQPVNQSKELDRLVERLWGGNYFTWKAQRYPIFYVPAIHRMLAAIGREDAIADEMTAGAEAIRALHYWSEEREFRWNAKSAAKRLRPLLPDILYRVEAAILVDIDYNPPDPELNELYDCLKLAEAEVKELLGEDDEGDQGSPGNEKEPAEAEVEGEAVAA